MSASSFLSKTDRPFDGKTIDDRRSTGITVAFRARTRCLHSEAERTGFVADLVHGRGSRESYVVFLRNLLPAYQAMERGLDSHCNSPALRELASYRLQRCSAIEADLAELSGPRWGREIPLLAAGVAYANRIARAADGDGLRLVAHAYTRYLGDISGGQILRRLLASSLLIEPSALSFFAFPGGSDLATLRARYRDSIDHAGTFADDPASIVEEAAVAFSLNIDLSCAVKTVAARVGNETGRSEKSVLAIQGQCDEVPVIPPKA